MPILSQRVSAGIRHNIAQFCQERNVEHCAREYLRTGEGSRFHRTTPRDVVNLRAMPAKCQHQPLLPFADSAKGGARVACGGVMVSMMKRMTPERL
jgi:hypothetical protein